MMDLVVPGEPISTREEVEKAVCKFEEITEHECRHDMEKEIQKFILSKCT